LSSIKPEEKAQHFQPEEQDDLALGFDVLGGGERISL